MCCHRAVRGFEPENLVPAPALSPFGGERELFSFGMGIKMHSPRSRDGPATPMIACPCRTDLLKVLCELTVGR